MNGTLKAVTSTAQQYVKYTYTHSGITYTGVHVFTTKAGTQSIMPAIQPEQFKYLENINPATVSATNVICKTNACTKTYFTNRFYGFFYQGEGHPVYADGIKSARIEDIYEENAMFGGQYYPSFCVKKDGTATIRWFKNISQIRVAADASQCIIGSYHPLVYNSLNVLKNRVKDYNDVLICDPTNFTNIHARFKGNEGDVSARKARTLLGHKEGNDRVYIMVCVDSGIALRAAADLMLDLKCDVAVNMDGSNPSEMRVREGYGAKGRVTSTGGFALPSAVCAFKKQ